MATFGPGGCISALLGAFLLHGANVFLGSPHASAAWGWKLTVPSDFTCAEGSEVGCVNGSTSVSGSSCTATSFDCTVTCPAGKTPNPAKVKVQCSKDATSTTYFDPKSGGACITRTVPGHTKDSTLSWSNTRPCDPAASAAVRVTWQPVAAVAMLAAAVPL